MKKTIIMGERLKLLREEKKLSHVILSKKIKEKYGVNISKDSLINYEATDVTNLEKIRKKDGMRIEYLRCFSDFYGVSADWILGNTDVRSPEIQFKGICDMTGLSERAVRMLGKMNQGKSSPSKFLDVLSGLIEIVDDAERSILLRIFHYLVFEDDVFSWSVLESNGRLVRYHSDDDVSLDALTLISDNEIADTALMERIVTALRHSRKRRDFLPEHYYTATQIEQPDN
jgi:hypothetical protein